MFDFQKEVIINSAEVDGLARVALIDPKNPTVRVDAASKKPLLTGSVLSVLRCAEYKKDGITEIVKTVGQKGEPAELTLAVPAVAEGDTLVGKTVHAEIVIGLDGKYMADYANVWSKFGKEIVVEYEAKTGDAAELAAHIKDALPLDNAFVKVDGTTLKLTDSHQIVKSAFVCLIKDEKESAHTKLNISKDRKREFATGAWLKENLRFPTHLNLRYDNVAGDDAPIDGATYTQYSFQYESERKGLHGQGTVGQKLTSVTTHTFYVNNTLTDILAVFNKLISGAAGNDTRTEATGDIYPVLEPMTEPQNAAGEDQLA